VEGKPLSQERRFRVFLDFRVVLGHFQATTILKGQCCASHNSGAQMDKNVKQTNFERMLIITQASLCESQIIGRLDVTIPFVACDAAE
jgi:hypothetical protein